MGATSPGEKHPDPTGHKGKRNRHTEQTPGTPAARSAPLHTEHRNGTAAGPSARRGCPEPVPPWSERALTSGEQLRFLPHPRERHHHPHPPYPPARSRVPVAERARRWPRAGTGASAGRDAPTAGPGHSPLIYPRGRAARLHGTCSSSPPGREPPPVLRPSLPPSVRPREGSGLRAGMLLPAVVGKSRRFRLEKPRGSRDSRSRSHAEVLGQ